MKRKTREWVRKAESDFRRARDVLNEVSNSGKLYRDQICFSCQQSAEKYLKALLEELAFPIPKTHNLIGIYALLTPNHPKLRTVRRGLYLSDFAVDFRYPGSWATKRQATAALRWADRIRTECRSILGIKANGRKKS